METRRRVTTILTTLLFLVVSVVSILAQDNPSPDNPAGPPSPDTVQSEPSGPPPSGPPPENLPQQSGSQPTEIPGRVARIQYMSGEVSMQPGGVNDWVAATQNRPLTTSDRVWTDKNSKAELNVGDGFIRMNSETSVTLSNVGDNTVQIELDQGTLEVTVRHLEGGEIYEIDTPNAAFTVMKPGVYRFDVFPNDDESWITVRKGYGEATGKGNAVRINAGNQVRFRNSNSLEHVAEAAPALDGFDDWANVRDNRLENSLSARYVSPGVIGAQDLDQYGSWRVVPTYGAIWVPTSVPVGWAPYRFGHWVWINPWGWTWVDDAPWGFAPFHYGRWVYSGGYWGWSPGPLGYWRPYYAPALVGWVGGPGFGIGFGWGGGWGFGVGVGFGWFPLGWGEPFFPWYGGWGWRGGWYYAGWHGGYWNRYCSPAYFRNVNITNTHITNITNISNNYYRNNFRGMQFANQHVSGAVTAAPRSAFTSGAAINRAGMAVSPSQLRNAQMVRTAQVSPTRESMLGGHSPLTHGTPPASAINRAVATRATPPARLGGAGETQAAATNGNHGPEGTAGIGANNNASHNVPRPPSAGGAQTSAQANTGTQDHNNVRYPQNTQEARATSPGNLEAHNVPRPPAANDSFARGSGNAGTANRTTAGNNAPPTTAASGGYYVPRPPSNYTYQPNRSNGEAASQTSRSANHQSAPATPAQHQSSPSQRESSPSRGSQSRSDHGSGNVERSSVARPPAGYSYRAAPAYTASSAYGANRSYGASSYGSNRMAYPSSNGYARSGGYSAGSSRGYSPSQQSYSGGRSYSSGPSYASRSYSAPRASYGGGGGGHYSGGAGGGHSSGGGGGHSGGRGR